jgi:hypothetical protein
VIGLLLAGTLLPVEPSAIDLADPIDVGLIADLDAIAGSGVSGDPRAAVVNRQRARRLSARVGRIVVALEGPSTLAVGDLGPRRSAACADVLAIDESAGLEHLGDQDNSLYTADAVHAYAEALDLAERAGLECVAELRRRLAALNDDLFVGYTERMGLLFRSYQQNHTLKVAAGLLAARLALDRGHDAEHPHNRWAVPLLARIHHALTTVDGGYGEGPSYWAYQAVNTLPVLFALGLADPECAAVEGPFDARLCRLVHANWRWALRVSVPLAEPYFAPFDDSTPGAWFAFAMIADPLAQAFALRRPKRSRPMAQLTWRLRGSVAEIEAQRSVVDYRAGQLGWVDEAAQAMVLLQVEHGRPMGEGLDQVGDAVDGTAGHNQTAPLSMMWMRGGRWRIIDPGYLGWSDRYPVARAGDHATVLIEGKGAQGPHLFTPSFTVDAEGNLIFDDPEREGGFVASEDGAAFGEVHSAGLGGLAGWRLAAGRTAFHVQTPPTAWRRVVFSHPDGRLLVFDDVRVAEAAEVSLRWQLPLGTEADGPGVWTVPAGGDDQAFAMHVAVVGGAGAVRASIADKVHDAWHWRRAQHRQVSVAVNGQSVRFLTSFLPLDEDPPALRDGGGFDLPGGPTFAVLERGWSLGSASFAEGVGLRDPPAGIEPLQLPDAIARGAAAHTLLAGMGGVELERFGACDEDLSLTDFVAGEGRCVPGVARVVSVDQEHQAPRSVRVFEPEPIAPNEPGPEAGCGCRDGRPVGGLWLLGLLAYFTRRTRRA